MKNRTIHQNLDTSFVNLSALIKYLRRRQFLGSVKVQLNGYMADIHLQADNHFKVSEHDQISGRVSEGEEAFQRILIRAREAGGTINVYQLVEDDFDLEKPIQQKKNAVNKKLRKSVNEPILDAEIIEPIPKPREKNIYQNGRSKKGLLKREAVKTPTAKNDFANPETNEDSLHLNRIQKLEIEGKPKTKRKTLPDFPFKLSNKVEAQAKIKEMSKEEWQLLMQLTAELLGIVDYTLAKERLDFTAAFRKASKEISEDYPFLNPASEIFFYKKGKIKMTEQVKPKIFVVSIIEVLRRILDKLALNQKFVGIHRTTVQTLIALMNKRKGYYDKFSITSQLKRILGV